MKYKLSDWVVRVMPLLVSGLLKEAKGTVVEGEVKICFHEWEIRIDLTPTPTMVKKIQDNY